MKFRQKNRRRLWSSFENEKPIECYQGKIRKLREVQDQDKKKQEAIDEFAEKEYTTLVALY